MSFEKQDGAADSGQRRNPLQAWSVAPYSFWRMVRLVLVVSISCALGTVVARWLRDDEDGATPRSPKNTSEPSIVAEGIERIVIRDKGRRVWEFAARKITITPDRQFAIATDMRQAILYRDDKPYLQLQASQVRLNQQTFDAEATGGVVASGPEGVKIKTERAQWTHLRRVLHCPTTVQATLKGLTVQTRNVSYDMPQSRLNCPQSIEVQGPRVNLRGDRAIVNVKNRQVEFGGRTEIVATLPQL